MNKYSTIFFFIILILSGKCFASPAISGGVWFNYSYIEDNERDKKTVGDISDEALILYIDGEAPEGKGNWSYSAEFRIGNGAFTDSENNASGDNSTLHKAWVGFYLSENYKLIVGKSQVPFAWKTANFWPGDMFQAAYGDQMDVGLKLMAQTELFDYQLAYFHADDWGETSTDSTDDNKHWGSSTTYRKVKTFVADVKIPMTERHILGLSGQSGKLQDLISPENDLTGDHQAWSAYYHGKFDNFYIKAEYIDGQRELPQAYASQANLVDTIENTRYGFEFSYQMNEWNFIFDATWAKPDTLGNSADTITAYAPGISYDYGPGWIYLEYLTQDGWIDRDMMIHEGDFDAWYLTIDFYF